MKLNNKISYIFLGVFLISLILFLLSALSAAVAERLNFGVCQQIRTLLGMVSLPFYPSAFELMIFALPILIVFAVIFVVRTKAHAELKRKFLRAVSVLSLLPSFYIYTLGIAYLSPRIADKVTDNAGYEELCQASYILAERASELSAVAGGALDLQDVRADLSRAYAQLLYGNARGRVALPKTKAAISSAFMSKMGVYGEYSYLTGEVILNSEIPSYILPFVIAHESSHALGFAGEADAELLAYLASSSSELPQIRYSAALCALEILLSELCSADSKEYEKVYSSLSARVKEDISEHREFVASNRGGAIFKISDGLNSAHLKLWDKSGTVGYGDAARLISLAVNNPSRFTRIKCSISTVFWSEKWDDSLFAGEHALTEKYTLAAPRTRHYQ